MVETERLKEMLAACDGATPGPWESRHGDEVWTPGEKYAADKYIGMFRRDKDAQHTANCDPGTMREILSELIAAREANAALMAERESLIATKHEQIAALTEERDKANRVATDRSYMLDAYWCMLGTNGLKVAEMWKANGVLRQHTSWGPEAWKLTGEERAAFLLDAEIAPKTLMESIDGSSSPPSIKDTSK